MLGRWTAGMTASTVPEWAFGAGAWLRLLGSCRFRRWSSSLAISLSAQAPVTGGCQLAWCHAAATAENGHGGAAAEEVRRPVPARAR